MNDVITYLKEVKILIKKMAKSAQSLFQENTMIRKQILLTKPLDDKVRQESQDKGISMSDVIRRILDRYYEQKEAYHRREGK